MKGVERLVQALLVGGALIRAVPAQALELPASCGAAAVVTDNKTPLRALRKRVEALAETDPVAAVRLLCDTIPRVVRTHGARSVELAWWTASLATPLIAYMDKFNEAIPLLQFAQPILEQHLDRYAGEVADIHVAYAWIAFRQGRLADSGAAWEEALKLRERAPGVHQIELQKVLVGLAQVRLSQRDFPATHAAVDRATAILRANHADVSEAGAAIENVQTNLATREENFARARIHAEAQIRIEQQLDGGAPQLVPAYVLLGTINARLDDFDASEAALREAIRLAESDHGPLQRHLMTALNQIAVLLTERDRPREALPFATRAVEVAEATLGPDAPKLAGVLRTLAEVQRALGDMPQALHLYQRAALIVEKHRADIESQVLVAHFRGLGNLQIELGDLEAARVALADGLDAAGDKPTLAIERGYVLLSLARATDVSDPERRRRLDQALALFQSRLPASHPLILRVINELCVVEIATRAEAPQRCDAARDWLVLATDVEPSLRSAVYQNQSELDQQRDRPADAYAEALQALAAAEAVGTPQPLYRAYFSVAAALRHRRQSELAIFFGKQAVGKIEELRSDFLGEDRQLERAFLTDKVSVYRAVADWLMESARMDEALDVLRLLKAEELHDYELRAATVATDAPVTYTEAEQRLRAEYSAALVPAKDAGAELDRLGRLRERNRLSAGERTSLETLLASQVGPEADRYERIRCLIEAGFGISAQADHPVRFVQAARLAAELRRFGADTALAVFLLTHDRLRMLIATRTEQREYDVPIDAAALQRDIGHFLEAVGRREDVTASSRALYEVIAGPLDRAAQRAHATRLVLWLDGALRYVPFAALNDGHSYLVDKYALQIYSLAERPAAAGVAASPLVLRVRGLGVTQAVGGFDALPSMADELCDVVRGPIVGLTRSGSACANLTTGRGALLGEGFADAAFTEQRFQSALADAAGYPVLHIGTHFSLRPGNTMRSFLVLGDGQKLSLDSISHMSFAGIDLVTLSACQTGLGGGVGDDGREIEGFSTIVQRGGAHQVIASLWQVEDKGTAALMRSLYESLAADAGDGGRALQQAQRALRAVTVAGRRPYEHPFYWAGFIVSVR